MLETVLSAAVLYAIRWNSGPGAIAGPAPERQARRTALADLAPTLRVHLAHGTAQAVVRAGTFGRLVIVPPD